MKTEKPNPDILQGPECYRVAERKARYGRRDWIIWRDRSGLLWAAKVTAETMKRALLDTGTQGYFSMIEASTCRGFTIRWRLGVVMLGNLKRGYWF